MSIERALGGINTLSDGWYPEMPNLKLFSELGDAIDELPDNEKSKEVFRKALTAMYMLTAQVLDTTRRMGYLFWSTKEFGLHADPALAKRIRRVSEKAKRFATAKDYKALTELLSHETHEQCDLIQDNYERILGTLVDDSWQIPAG